MFQNFSAMCAGVASAPGDPVAARPLIPADDWARIAHIASEAAASDDPNGRRLLKKLHAAEPVEPGQIPDDVVLMGDLVTYRTERGTSRTLALIHPEDGNCCPGELSVLTPLGTALLGQRAGDRVAVESGVDAWNLTVLIERKGGSRKAGGSGRLGAVGGPDRGGSGSAGSDLGGSLSFGD